MTDSAAPAPLTPEEQEEFRQLHEFYSRELGPEWMEAHGLISSKQRSDLQAQRQERAALRQEEVEPPEQSAPGMLIGSTSVLTGDSTARAVEAADEEFRRRTGRDVIDVANEKVGAYYFPQRIGQAALDTLSGGPGGGVSGLMTLFDINFPKELVEDASEIIARELLGDFSGKLTPKERRDTPSAPEELRGPTPSVWDTIEEVIGRDSRTAENVQLLIWGQSALMAPVTGGLFEAFDPPDPNEPFDPDAEPGMAQSAMIGIANAMDRTEEFFRDQGMLPATAATANEMMWETAIEVGTLGLGRGLRPGIRAARRTGAAMRRAAPVVGRTVRDAAWSASMGVDSTMTGLARLEDWDRSLRYRQVMHRRAREQADPAYWEQYWRQQGRARRRREAAREAFRQDAVREGSAEPATIDVGGTRGADVDPVARGLDEPELEGRPAVRFQPAGGLEVTDVVDTGRLSPFLEGPEPGRPTAPTIETSPIPGPEETLDAARRQMAELMDDADLERGFQPLEMPEDPAVVAARQRARMAGDGEAASPVRFLDPPGERVFTEEVRVPGGTTEVRTDWPMDPPGVLLHPRQGRATVGQREFLDAGRTMTAQGRQAPDLNAPNFTNSISSNEVRVPASAAGEAAEEAAEATVRVTTQTDMSDASAALGATRDATRDAVDAVVQRAQATARAAEAPSPPTPTGAPTSPTAAPPAAGQPNPEFVAPGSERLTGQARERFLEVRRAIEATEPEVIPRRDPERDYVNAQGRLARALERARALGSFLGLSHQPRNVSPTFDAIFTDRMGITNMGLERTAYNIDDLMVASRNAGLTEADMPDVLRWWRGETNELPALFDDQALAAFELQRAEGLALDEGLVRWGVLHPNQMAELRQHFLRRMFGFTNESYSVRSGSPFLTYEGRHVAMNRPQVIVAGSNDAMDELAVTRYGALPVTGKWSSATGRPRDIINYQWPIGREGLRDQFARDIGRPGVLEELGARPRDVRPLDPLTAEQVQEFGEVTDVNRLLYATRMRQYRRIAEAGFNDAIKRETDTAGVLGAELGPDGRIRGRFALQPAEHAALPESARVRPDGEEAWVRYEGRGQDGTPITSRDPLRGWYVRRDVLDTLEALRPRDQDQSWVGQVWDGFLRGFKWNKTVLSPRTMARQWYSLLWQGLMAEDGLQALLTRRGETWDAIFRRGTDSWRQWHDEMVRNGILGVEFTEVETRALMEAMSRNNTENISDYVARFVTAGTLRKNPPTTRVGRALARVGEGAARMYNAGDQYFRASLYMHYRQSQGLSPRAAAAKVDKWTPNYAKVGRSVDKLRRSPLGAPFFTWRVENYRIMKNAAIEAPHRLAAALGLTFGMNYVGVKLLDAAGAFGEDDELLEAELDAVRTMYGTDRLSVGRDAQGRMRLSDMTFIDPTSEARGWFWSLGDLVTSMTGLPMREQAMANLKSPEMEFFDRSLEAAGVATNPVLTGGLKLFRGVDPDTGQRLGGLGDRVGSAIGDFVPGLTPPIPSPGGGTFFRGGRNAQVLWASLMEEQPSPYRGEQDPWTAVMDAVLGLTATPEDFDLQTERYFMLSDYYMGDAERRHSKELRRFNPYGVDEESLDRELDAESERVLEAERITMEKLERVGFARIRPARSASEKEAENKRRR